MKIDEKQTTAHVNQELRTANTIKILESKQTTKVPNNQIIQTRVSTPVCPLNNINTE